MDIKKMPLVDDLAQSILAVKDHLPVQTAKDLTGMLERSAKFSRLSKIGIAAMGISSIVALILSGIAHYFAPSAGIAEFDVPRILIDTFSSASQTGVVSTTHGNAGVANVSTAVYELFNGPAMKFIMLAATVIAIATAVIQQTFVPVIMVMLLAGSTTLLGSFMGGGTFETDQAQTEINDHGESPQERFKKAISDQDTATLLAMLTESSQAATYLKAQMAIKNEKQTSPVVGDAAKAIVLGNLGFAPNNQVAYAIEHSAGGTQLSTVAKSYVEPAIAKSDFFTSLSHWVGVATLIFGVPGITVLLLHLSIQRRIRRIGRLGLVLIG